MASKLSMRFLKSFEVFQMGKGLYKQMLLCYLLQKLPKILCMWKIIDLWNFPRKMSKNYPYNVSRLDCEHSKAIWNPVLK